MIYTFTLNTAVDKIISLEEPIGRRKNNHIASIKNDVGGKATHVSIILSQLNIDNIATGFIGSRNKDILLNIMEDIYGVKTEFIEQDAYTRTSFVILDPSNEGSFMLTQKGFEISEESFDKLKSYINTNIKHGDITVFAGSPPKGIDTAKYKHLLSMAADKGAKVLADAAGDFLKTAVSIGAYLIKPNEDEFKELTGTDIADDAGYICHLDNIREKGAKNIVLSLGSKGSILAKDNGEIYRYFPPAVTQRNDTGTGDSFVGGIVAGISRGEHLEDALIYATAVSASKASRVESSGFDEQEALMFLKKVKREKWR